MHPGQLDEQEAPSGPSSTSEHAPAMTRCPGEARFGEPPLARSAVRSAILSTMSSSVVNTPDASGPSTEQPSPSQRLAWLDALRGIAALVVAAHHFGLMRLVPGGDQLTKHFDLGVFGVFLFFIISGWIIPASLERRGDVRRFWVGRVFRIYPLIIVVVLITLLLPAAYSPIHHQLHKDVAWSLVANSTLLHDFLGVPSAISVMWTLGFEMIFYYLVTALFLTGRTRSPAAPLLFAALAVIGGLSTASTWATTRWNSWHTRHVLIAATVVGTVSGLTLLLQRRRSARVTGALLLCGMGLGLLVFNARAPMFECGAILATMFAGTICYRVRENQIDRRLGLGLITVVIAAGALAGWLYNRPPRNAQTWTKNPEQFVLPFLAAWALFGLGVLLSAHHWPRLLAWLGRISYSMYIVHVPVMWTVFWLKDTYLTLPAGRRGQQIVVLIELALLLVVSEITYRLVELPGQWLGRRLSGLLQPIDDRPAANGGSDGG